MGITDSSGALVRSYEYEPFGNPTGGSGSASSVLRFAGGHLTLAGLYHFGERYYDPEIGRWTQQDPLNQYSDLKQANRYVYVGQDPVNQTDPTGTDFIGDAWNEFSDFTGVEPPSSVGDALKGAATGAVFQGLQGSVVGAAVGAGLGVFDATPGQIAINVLGFQDDYNEIARDWSYDYR